MSGSLNAPTPLSFYCSHRLSPLNSTASFVRCKARFEAVRHSGKMDTRKKKLVAKKLAARKSWDMKNELLGPKYPKKKQKNNNKSVESSLLGEQVNLILSRLNHPRNTCQTHSLVTGCGLGLDLVVVVVVVVRMVVAFNWMYTSFIGIVVVETACMHLTGCTHLL
jgi:hypothetical protein